MKQTKQTTKIVVVIAVIMIGALLLLRQKNTSANLLIPVASITHGHGLAVDVADPNKLYIATHHGLLALQNNELLRIGDKADDYMGFSAHPTEANVFFSSGHPAAGGNIGFQISEDGGFTWRKISNGLDGPVDFHAMAVSPADPNLAYGWYRGNLQRTRDGGKIWEKFATDVPLIALAADPKKRDTVYAASPQGLLKSENQGEAWQLLFDGFVSAIAIQPRTGRVFSFSERFGLAISDDAGAGAEWQTIQADFGGGTPLFIAFAPSSPDTGYLLTEKNRLYQTADGGETWRLFY